MPNSKPLQADDIASTFVESRLKEMSVRISDVALQILSPEAVAKHIQFEETVERRLRNGAKFIPRKRQPS